MKNSTSILDLVTLVTCTIIMSILFNGVILLIGAIYLGYKAYSSYKEFLTVTEQETVKESMVVENLITVFSQLKAEKLPAKKVDYTSVNWLDYQLGLNF